MARRLAPRGRMIDRLRYEPSRTDASSLHSDALVHDRRLGLIVSVPSLRSMN